MGHEELAATCLAPEQIFRLGWSLAPPSGLCDWCGADTAVAGYEVRGPRTARACCGEHAALIHLEESRPFDGVGARS